MLQDLLTALDRLGERDIDLENVAALVASADVGGDVLEPLVRFEPNRYTRHLVRRTPLFDVMVICWAPGARTPIHDHSGQLGWVRVVRGALEERTYELHPDTTTCRVGSPVRLFATGVATFPAGPGVVTVDRERAIHRLGNPSDHEEAISLHVYSRPHDACRRYEPGTGIVRRAELSFDSQLSASARVVT